MCVCKYLNQTVRRNRWKEWKIFQGCFKNKKEKKKHLKELSFMTQFKIEFLLLFTGCRKVLGKMLANEINSTEFFKCNFLTIFFPKSFWFIQLFVWCRSFPHKRFSKFSTSKKIGRTVISGRYLHNNNNKLFD